jgi:hypothetical protein
MRGIHRAFARLAPRDVPLAVEAALAGVAVNVAVRCARLRTIVRALDALPRTRALRAEGVPRVVRIAEGVTRRLWPDATCLKRGLVAYALLRRRRIDASFVIAHRIRPFEGHAWVEHEGRVVCGVDRTGTFHELWRAPRVGETCPERAKRVEG